MSDLISRSALMKEIESLSMRIIGLRAGKGVLVEVMNEYKKSVLRIIDEQPTAYDVDAVVEDMQDSTVEFELFGVCSEYIPKHIVINAVRKGGVNE